VESCFGEIGQVLVNMGSPGLIEVRPLGKLVFGGSVQGENL
jgi:hypothetical protein